MPNMSYCRFNNTLNDLRDCEEALRNNEPLSESEAKKAKSLIRLCQEIADNYTEDDVKEEEEEEEED